MSKVVTIITTVLKSKKLLGIVKAGLIAGATALGLAVTPEVTEVFCAITPVVQ